MNFEKISFRPGDTIRILIQPPTTMHPPPPPRVRQYKRSSLSAFQLTCTHCAKIRSGRGICLPIKCATVFCGHPCGQIGQTGSAQSNSRPSRCLPCRFARDKQPINTLLLCSYKRGRRPGVGATPLRLSRQVRENWLSGGKVVKREQLLSQKMFRFVEPCQPIVVEVQNDLRTGLAVVLGSTALFQRRSNQQHAKVHRVVARIRFPVPSPNRLPMVP